VRTLDWALVAAFALYAVASGLRARRQASRNLEEYFLAGRSLRGFEAGASMAATQFAADTPLLVTGLVATAGIFSLWRLWIYALAFLLLGFVLAPSWRRAGVLTDAALAEQRYAGRAALALRTVKAVYFGTVFNCAVLAMVLFAAKEIAEPFLLWDQWLPAPLFHLARSAVEAVGTPFARAGGAGDIWLRSTNNVLSLLAIVGVTWLYSATGGLRSVVRTDVVQLAVMLVGTAAYAVLAVRAVGGLDALGAQLRALHPAGGAGLSAAQILAFTPGQAADAGGFVLAVLGLQWLVQMNADGTGYLAQRAMACRSDRDARVAALVFTFLQVVLRSLLWLPIALALLVIYPMASGDSISDREASFVRGMVELLPTGILGLMVTAMLAALASTLDTHLNWGASYWTHDLYRRLWMEELRGRRPSERSLVWVARASNASILFLALALMTRLDSIQHAWQVSLLLGAGMGVMLVLRWLWWRVNAWGELATAAASLILAPLLLTWFPGAEAPRLLLMAALATAVGVATSLATPAEELSCLQRFYDRARPPGFWGPVGTREDVRRLIRGLRATAAAACTVFGLLVGLGTALAGSPAPGALPRPLWIALLLLGALAAVPLWWRQVRSRNEPEEPALSR